MKNCKGKCKPPILCDECLMSRVLTTLMKDPDFRKKSGEAKLTHALFILNLARMKRDRIDLVRQTASQTASQSSRGRKGKETK